MNWKCVLVGLALVFPGTLVSVEGRYYNEEDRDVRAQDGVFDTLVNLFRDQHRRLERFNSRPEETAPAVDKKLDTTKNNKPPHPDVQKIEENAAAGKPDAEVTPPERSNAAAEINHAVAARQQQGLESSRQGVSGNGLPAPNSVFIMVVAGCTVLAAVGIVGAGVCWYKYHKSAKAASVVDYPAYGVTGPTKDRAPSPGDRKLAHSAQMYHYQHQKQQMMALQSASSGEMKHDGSDDESVEDNDDADYTVYECPGLAPTGEMEVKNPLFCGDETPSTPANDDTRPTPPEY